MKEWGKKKQKAKVEVSHIDSEDWNIVEKKWLFLQFTSGKQSIIDIKHTR